MDIKHDAVEFRIEGRTVRAERTDTKGTVLLTLPGDNRVEWDLLDSASDAAWEAAVFVITRTTGKKVGAVATNSEVRDLANLLASVVDQD